MRGQVYPQPRHIRHMGEHDIAAVAALEDLVADHPCSAALLRQEMQLPDRVYLTAWQRTASRLTTSQHQELVGHGGVQRIAGEAHITTIAVPPQAQGRGVGGHVLTALLGAAVQLGADAATLEVRSTNLMALRLYQRAGFVEAGRRPGYYTSTGEDAIIMWLHDLTGLHQPRVSTPVASAPMAPTQMMH